MRRTIWLALAVGSALILGGCETTPTKPPPEEVPVEERRAPPPELEGEAARLRSLVVTPGFEGNPLDDPASPLAKKVIYFEFDSSEIVDEFLPVVEAHATYLAAKPDAAILLEGHADERGSREYNLGLGERRALTVSRMLVLLGGADDQLRSVSYGEEQPAAEGHDESAWKLNRRVEIIYRVR